MNTSSDAQIDIITARNKKYTIKDDVITYLFIAPIAVTNIVPFIMAYNSGLWGKLNVYFIESYSMLDQLPSWYPYIVGLIVVDVLGFRTFARKVIDNYISKKLKS